MLLQFSTAGFRRGLDANRVERIVGQIERVAWQAALSGSSNEFFGANAPLAR